MQMLFVVTKEVYAYEIDILNIYCSFLSSILYLNIYSGILLKVEDNYSNR